MNFIESIDLDGTSPFPLSINPSGGNVGIGTTNPQGILHVAGPTAGNFYIGINSAGATIIGTDADGNLNLKPRIDGKSVFIRDGNTQKGLRLYGGGMNYIESVDTDGTSPFHLSINPSGGNVGIGTTSPSRKLTVRGNILVQSESTGSNVLELGEGLDLAEGFDISSITRVNAGAVMIIDPDNPGKLTLSNKPYDIKVAGIVAGANGMGSGVRLGAGLFDYDIALAGRVYCSVDATQTGVEPGDLLTTSAIPGYAMKATDYSRAQGAILGKAMQNLEKGNKGQILVLVTLQ
jgi:hypothetical protein